MRAARLSFTALACAALADGAGNGNTAQQLSRAPLSSMSVQLLRASAGRDPLGTGLTFSPDNPGEWARSSHDKKTLRMAGLPDTCTCTCRCAHCGCIRDARGGRSRAGIPAPGGGPLRHGMFERLR